MFHARIPNTPAVMIFPPLTLIPSSVFIHRSPRRRFVFFVCSYFFVGFSRVRRRGQKQTGKTRTHDTCVCPGGEEVSGVRRVYSSRFRLSYGSSRAVCAVHVSRRAFARLFPTRPGENDHGTTARSTGPGRGHVDGIRELSEGWTAEFQRGESDGVVSVSSRTRII